MSVEGKTLTVQRQKARRAVVAGRARWLHSRPVAVEVRSPEKPPTRHARTPFGFGLLRSAPSYRMDCTHEDAAWWAEESRREEDRIIDRMYEQFRAQERIENGLDAY